MKAVNSRNRIMEATPFSEIFQQFLHNNNRQSDYLERCAITVFKEKLPPMFQPYIKKISCTNGVLFVQISNAACKFDLMTQRTKLMQQINQQLGKNVVKDILLK